MLSAAHAGELCTVLADAATGKIVRQQGVCDQRVTPASTFKIALSLMGYDSGFLKSEHVPALPFRQGYPDWLPSWRQTTDPTSWIANSVVWYSQKITESLGEQRFHRYVVQFGYGNQDLTGDPGNHNGLTGAWLSSSLEISPLEQVAFLEKVANHRLGVSPKAYAMTERITAIATLPNGWVVHGKTGTGSAALPDGTLDESHSYGWFVGWATKASRQMVFVCLIQDEKPEAVRAGLRARDALLKRLPGYLDEL